MPEGDAARSRLMVIMFTDIADSTALKGRMGAAVYASLLRAHNRTFRAILAAATGAQELEFLGDGFLAQFTTASDAVEAALRFQHALQKGPWEGDRLRVRVGLHLGEVLELDIDAHDHQTFVGTALDFASRVESVALPGQVLMSGAVFDDARQYVREHPDVGNGSAPTLKWMAHGPYLFKGGEQPMALFEVGAEGVAPLAAPTDTEKARRIIAPDEEELLGWRPAVGLEVPGRPRWVLRGKLGEGGFGEVWVGEHRQTKDSRVFKFCFETGRVRSFQRELTLFRLIRSALGDRSDIARLHEVQLEHAPYFLESEFTEEGDLKSWADRQGGIASVPLAVRLDLLARVAWAAAAAHSVGVLHKDIKASNILIYRGDDGAPRPRLADFGIGAIADRSSAAAAGITVAGFTQSLVEDTHSSRASGTRMYAPPESLTGQAFTVQGDIYALGILLYQLVVGDLDRPLGQGWERDVDDEVLREDIGQCVDVDPDRRPRGAAELAERLRGLNARRATRRRGRLARVGMIASVALLAVAAFATLALVRERGLRHVAEAARAESDWQAYRTSITAAALAMQANDIVGSKQLLDGAAVERRGWEWEYLRHQLRQWETVLDAPSRAVGEICIDETRGEVLAALADGSVGIWSTDGWRWIRARATDLELTTVSARMVQGIVALGTLGGDVVLWDRTTDTLRPLAVDDAAAPCVPGGEQVKSLQFSGDGASLLVRRAGDALLVRVPSGQVVDRIESPLPAIDSEMDVATRFTVEAAVSCALDPAARLVVLTAASNQLLIWHPETAETRLTPPMDEAPTTIAFDPTGGTIAVGMVHRNIHLLDSSTAEIVRVLTGHGSAVRALDFSTDGTHLASTSEDGKIIIWDVATGEIIRTYIGAGDDPRSVRFSGDSRTVLSRAAEASQLRAWPLDRAPPVIGRFPTYVYHLACSPDGTRLAVGLFVSEVGDDENACTIWAIDTLRPTVVQELPNSSSPLVFSHDGTMLRLGYSRWDVSNASVVRTFERAWDLEELRQHSWPSGLRASKRLRYSPDGRVYAYIEPAYPSSRARVMLFGEEVPSYPAYTRRAEEVLAILPAPEAHGCAFSPDGQHLATTHEDSTVRIWDVETWSEVAVLRGHTSKVYCVEYSPDGTRLASGSNDNTIRIWSVETGDSLLELRGHTSYVFDIVFTPDGTRLFSASGDKTVRAWETAGAAARPGETDPTGAGSGSAR